MKFYERKKFTNIRNTIILANLFLLMILLFLKVYEHFKGSLDVVFGTLFPFMLSFVIVYCLMPFIDILNYKLKMNRKLSILIVLSLFLFLIGYLILSLFPLLINQFSSFLSYLFGNKDIIKNSLQNSIFFKNLNIEEILSKINIFLFDQSITILNSGINIISSTFSLFFMTPIFTIMLIFSYDNIKIYIKKMLIKSNKKNFIPLIKSIDEGIGKYVKVTLLDCFIIGSISFIFFSILGLEYIQLFSLIVGIGNLIPFIGPFITLIPVLFYTLLKSPQLFLIVLVTMTIFQGIEANIIKPWLTNKSMHIHPITTLLAVLISASLLGITGAILAIPIYIVIKLSILYYLEQKKNKKNELKEKIDSKD